MSKGRRPPPDGDLYGSAGSSTLARIAALGALLAAIALVLIVFLGGESGYSYRLYFETGGQLVPGNQVQVGGHPIGTVDEIELTDDWQAEVSISVDEELHEGTTAVIRTTSLSGIANRYISVTPGPDNAPALEDGDVITAQDTTSPVDLDQLFDAFRPKRAPRAPQRDPGLRDRATPARRGGERDLQVPQPRAQHRAAPARRADPRPAGVHQTSSSTAPAWSTRSPSAATTSPR